MFVQHHPTLSNLTCCTRLATMLHQTWSSTSSVPFVLRSEQQCGICLAITFNIFACALVQRLSVSMVMVYSLHLFRALPRQFKLQNGERAKSWQLFRPADPIFHVLNYGNTLGQKSDTVRKYLLLFKYVFL